VVTLCNNIQDVGTAKLLEFRAARSFKKAGFDIIGQVMGGLYGAVGKAMFRRAP
jgi:hypothetical protein